MSISIIDHEALAISRLATQFRESTNLINYIKTLLIEANTLEQVFCDLLNNRWIDTAEGVNLDIIGAIVGQPRTLVDATAIAYFGFAGFVASKSFGTVLDGAVGGRFRSVDEPTSGNRNLIDEEYRVFITARILANKSSVTIQDVIDSTKAVLGDFVITITEGVEAEYTVNIGADLSDNDKTFILNTTILPKPAGVTVNYEDNSGPF